MSLVLPSEELPLAMNQTTSLLSGETASECGLSSHLEFGATVTAPNAPMFAGPALLVAALQPVPGAFVAGLVAQLRAKFREFPSSIRPKKPNGIITPHPFGVSEGVCWDEEIRGMVEAWEEPSHACRSWLSQPTNGCGLAFQSTLCY